MHLSKLCPRIHGALIYFQFIGICRNQSLKFTPRDPEHCHDFDFNWELAFIVIVRRIGRRGRRRGGGLVATRTGIGYPRVQNIAKVEAEGLDANFALETEEGVVEVVGVLSGCWCAPRGWRWRRSVKLMVYMSLVELLCQ